MREKNLVLIGMMGCGKSTAGALLARRLGLELADTDAFVEETEGRTIPEIFAADGEAHFRRAEEAAARALAARSGLVIACGGGLPLREESIRPLKESGTVFFLRRDPGEIYDTVSMDGRPLGQGGKEAFLARFAQREPVYRRWADHVIEEFSTPDATVRAILEVLGTMKLLVVNGPNLNLLGKREPGIYGENSYESLCESLKAFGAANGAEVDCFQSNHEGAIVDAIQQADGVYDGIVMNPGAYTHYSVAILDALKAVSVPCVEVHISNVHQREEFRHKSVTAPACVGQICGLGLYGYQAALSYFLSRKKVGKESFH